MKMTYELGTIRGSHAKPKTEKISEDGRRIIREYHTISIDLPDLLGSPTEIVRGNRVRAAIIEDKLAEVQATPARWQAVEGRLPELEEKLQTWVNTGRTAEFWLRRP